MYKYFDTHAHLQMKDYDEDREELIKNLQAENIGVVVVGVDKETSFEAVVLAEKYENVFATIGYHPQDSQEEFRGEDLSELIKNPKVVAVGECGLEFLAPFEKGRQRRPSSPTGLSDMEKQRQVNLFKKQIDFAIKYEKPLVIHCRDAHHEVLEILKEKKVLVGEKLRGVIHFFSGDLDIAKQYLDLGFYLSFGGVLTFTRDYDEVVKFVPLEKILPETDAPFVAPVPYRGQRNSPLYIKEVVKRIAEIKQIGLIEVENALISNILRIFCLA